jgi:putative serine protease PepD
MPTPVTYPSAPPSGGRVAAPPWASPWDPPPAPPTAPLPPVPPVGDPNSRPSWPAPDQGEPSRRGGRPALLAAVVGAVVGALVAGGLIFAFDDDTTPVATVADDRPAATIPDAPGGAMDIQAVLASVEESVVTIEIQGEGGGGVFAAAGTGVIIDDSGIVLTNAHVVAGAQTMTIRFFDGTTSTGQLIGSFPDDDVALVQLADTDGLSPATLGDSDDLQVGDEVLAIGNALDLTGQPTVTRGIVSALDRSISGPTQEGDDIDLDNLIQTDAAINPGNSGGPLVAADGTVVGINTAIIPDAQNLGFAISIDALKPLIDDIEAGNADVTPDTAFLGVSTADVADVTQGVLDRFGVSADDEGGFVVEVVPDSGAADGGLHEGDLITEIDGERVTSSEEVRSAVRSHEPGDDLTVTVQRDGEEQELDVTLGAVVGGD